MLNKYFKSVLNSIIIFLLGSYLISLLNNFSLKDGFFLMTIIYTIGLSVMFTDESPTIRDRYKFDKFNHFI